MVVYILGAGAIGLALAAHLIQDGEDVLVVRTSTGEVSQTTVEIVVHDAHSPSGALTVSAQVVSLAQLETLDGMVVVTAKAYANEQIAEQLQAKNCQCPIIILQNGIGVEEPYLRADFPEVYRCILYATSQKSDDYQVQFKPVASSPIGLIKGEPETLSVCVDYLNTDRFPFHVSEQIQQAIWKKAIINAVFNTICPLLEVDNGIFARNEHVAKIADDIVGESVQVAHALGVNLEQQAIMTQLLAISKGSDGQLISTLQDLNKGNRTEVESLNLEIARIAAHHAPNVAIGRTKLLGELILLKSLLRRNVES